MNKEELRDVWQEYHVEPWAELARNGKTEKDEGKVGGFFNLCF